MYKDLQSIFITGACGTGKTTFIKKYIDEVLNDDVNIYLVDLKMCELHTYNKNEKVVYINKKENIVPNMVDVIKANDHSKKTYIFIDEYFEIKIHKEIHSQIKEFLFNKDKYNLEIIFTSQMENSLCANMKKHLNSQLILNGRFVCFNQQNS